MIKMKLITRIIKTILGISYFEDRIEAAEKCIKLLEDQLESYPTTKVLNSVLNNLNIMIIYSNKLKDQYDQYKISVSILLICTSLIVIAVFFTA
jgi:hypothetical protein